MQHTRQPTTGFTLIELLIVISSIAVLTAIALPVYQDYAIRSNAEQALNTVAAAKRAVTEICLSKPDTVVESNGDTGFSFSESMAPDSLLANVQVQANCAAGTMWVGVRTKNTGANRDPVLLLTSLGPFVPLELGSRNGLPGAVKWDCRGVAERAAHLPSGCRLSEMPFAELTL